ncbi:LytR C-terminal domain-containing protein [Leifsonia poae]|uniref:LytR C-terminal domain-containing protein n=1 Tax=Leifsonia poae TaxID=110933 RepID=UPI003D69019B
MPTVDPSLSVNVLNGTTREGLAGQVGDKLTAAGWKVGATANADKSDLASTIVYYGDPKNQAAALGVAQSLPGATVQQSTAFSDTGADITVVVGANYQG